MAKFEEPKTIDECLMYAEEAERTMRDLHFTDPARRIFARERDFFLEEAVKMEKRK